MHVIFCELCHKFCLGSSVSRSGTRGTTITFAGESKGGLEQDEDILPMSERNTRSGFWWGLV